MEGNANWGNAGRLSAADTQETAGRRGSLFQSRKSSIPSDAIEFLLCTALHLRVGHHGIYKPPKNCLSSIDTGPVYGTSTKLKGNPRKKTLFDSHRSNQAAPSGSLLTQEYRGGRSQASGLLHN